MNNTSSGASAHAVGSRSRSLTMAVPAVVLGAVYFTPRLRKLLGDVKTLNDVGFSTILQPRDDMNESRR